ncbi:peptidoglycan/LPS O-acetylase OafA/YrhL [Sphingomonas sp. BE138]|uniref:acyltransferase family protein n=1 Tax=Sphingomonas sp. BE138 TaxID=2817845 RepID=UPI00285AF8C4|nr:acyltransferase [Sphingomonas sp. BE138]MDR6790847.1 peptidoglycan/LPS O-acetylase OafA/YrhL [Sphingomonas sp. BE138]
MRKDHYPSLDALRGIGAFFVLVLHLSCADPVTHLFARGYLGVDLFFQLSGFVIGHAYQTDLQQGSITLSAYLQSRVRRLYPMIFLGALLSLCFVSYDIAPPSLFVQIGAQAAIVPLLWATGPIFPLNTPQWSLFFELAANLAHGVVARHLGVGRLGMIVLGSAALFCGAIMQLGSADIGVASGGVAGGFARVAFGFFTGLLMQRLWVKGVPRSFPNSSLAAMALFVMVVIGAGRVTIPRALVDGCVAMVFCPAVVWLALSDPRPFRFPRLARQAGRLSYPIYAIHVPLITAAYHVVDVSGSGVASRSLLWMVMILVVVVLADVLERVYDRPLRHWLNARATPKRSIMANISVSPSF